MSRKRQKARGLHNFYLIMKSLLILFLLNLGLLTGVSSAAEKVVPPLLQSQVKGLLIMTLADGSHAGTASQMNATAVPAKEPEGGQADGCRDG